MQHIKEPLRIRILEIALNEFAQKGYDGASMRVIAEGAGTSLGNLYRYFRSKDDLYMNCLKPVLDGCVSQMEEHFDVSAEALSHTAAHMALYVGKYRQVFRIIIQGPTKHYAAFLERFGKCVAEKLRKNAGGHVAHNPGFYDGVALGFISSLREILENDYNEADTAAYVLELMLFLFADFRDRVLRLQ